MPWKECSVTSTADCLAAPLLRLPAKPSDQIVPVARPNGRRVCIALALLVAAVFSAPRLAAQTAVPPGACLYALDATAANAFEIAGAQSVYTACGVVSESSSSSAFEMEGTETLYLENHAQVSVVGGANLTGQTYLYDTLSSKDVSAVQTSNPGDPLSGIAPPTSGTIVGASPTYYDMNSKPANDTISPGVYCGGLTIGNTNGTTFKFSPGMYIMAGGGLTLNSEATVTVAGAGVTFYNTSSTLTYSLTAGAVLTAGTHTLTVTFAPSNPKCIPPLRPA